jgi:sugar-specific transcriptional regulator TrmB
MNDKSKLLEYLKKLDLTDIEAEFYLTLLNTGPISVRDLAQKTGIKRTTSYLYIDQLVEKGLAMKLVKNTKKQVAATQPDQIQYLIEKKLETTKSLQIGFPDILKSLKTIRPHSDSGDAEIKYFKGAQSIQKIYHDALRSNELCLYGTLSELAPVLNDPNIFDDAFKRNPKLKIYEIYGDSLENIQKFSYKASSARYFYKFMPPELELTAPGILHYDNKVAVINVKGNQSSVTVLHDKVYYDNSRKLFNFIWSMLPEPSI